MNQLQQAIQERFPDKFNQETWKDLIPEFIQASLTDYEAACVEYDRVTAENRPRLSQSVVDACVVQANEHLFLIPNTMAVAEKPKLNTLAWIASWVNQPKVNSSVDGVKLAVFQVFKHNNPVDLPTRAGVDFLVGIDEQYIDSVPDAKKGIWLVGANMWSYLVNFKNYIPDKNHTGPLQAPGTEYTPHFNPDLPREQRYELTRKQGYCVAQFMPLVGFIGEEFVGEGWLREEGWQNSDNHVSEFEKGVVERLKERYAAEGKTMYYKCQYGAFYTFWHRMKPGWRLNGETTPSPPTHSFFRNLLRNRADARTACLFFIDNMDGLGMVHDIKFYAEDFMSRHHFYLVLYVLRVCVFGTLNDNGTPRNRVMLHFWAKVEQLPMEGITWSIHNGLYYRRRIDSKGGTVVTSEHPQVDHNLLEALCLFTFATGVIVPTGQATGYGIADVLHWENSEIFGTDPNYMTKPNPTPPDETGRMNLVKWEPDTDQPAPWTDGVLGYPESPMGYMDIAPRAKLLYNTTSKTAGMKWRDCKYKCIERNGVPVTESWVEPSLYNNAQDGGTVLDWANMYDGFNADQGPGKVRGGLALICRDKTSEGQRHLSMMWYHAGRGPMVIEKYLVEPWSGKQFYITVQGGVPEVFNESY